MKCKRVLYSDRFTKEIQSQLRITKFEKVKSKKNNVYFVYFASDSDAEYAMKRCKKLKNVTIKPYLSYSSISTTEKDTQSSITVIHQTPPPPPLTTTATTKTEKVNQPKVKLTARYLPPNSSEVCQVLESIDSCLNAISSMKCTFDEIYQMQKEKPNEHQEELINRLYTQHSSAFYLKLALVVQLKVIYSSNARIQWSTIAPKVYAFQRSIDQEQIFLNQIDLKTIHLSKNIDFQSSITTSSKLAFELVKLSQK